MALPHRLPEAVLLGLLLLAAAGCDLSIPAPATPTVEPVLTETSLPTPTLTLSAPTSTPASISTPRREVRLEPPTETFTPAPPTETFTPTPTPGPIEHTIQEGETLGYIIQLYGYTDLGVIDQIVAINPSIPNPDRLPGAGTIILIPRPTATPTPAGFAETATAVGGQPSQFIQQPGEILMMDHAVREGETIIGIAGQYDTNLVILDRLNPELQFFNCDFDNPSGGPDCNVPLQVAQIVKVPAPTPTPTLSPTPSGNETATPTPTYAAPVVVFPPEGGIARSRSIKLQWITTGILAPEYSYLVQVRDTTTSMEYAFVTRETFFTLGSDLAPAAGASHAMQWRIVIGTALENSDFRIVSGGAARWRSFQWQPS